MNPDDLGDALSVARNILLDDLLRRMREIERVFAAVKALKAEPIAETPNE